MIEKEIENLLQMQEECRIPHLHVSFVAMTLQQALLFIVAYTAATSAYACDFMWSSH